MREHRGSAGDSYAEVIGLVSYGDEIIVPASVNGREVRGLRLLSPDDPTVSDKIKRCFPGVKRIIFSSDIKIHSLYNTNFPDLEDICFAGARHENNFSDGMLFDHTGKRLLLTFQKGMWQDEIRIPPGVEEISQDAFLDAGVCRIVFSNPWIRVSGNPFKGSAWYEKHRQEKKTLYVGNMVFRNFNEDELVLDSSVKRISSDCFQQCCPRRFSTHFIPNDAIIDALDRGGCETIAISSGCDIEWDIIRRWKGLKNVYLPAHNKYMDRDGIVFDRKKKELVFYPPGRKAGSYRISDGTRRVGYRAFMGQRYLQKVTLCESVTGIGQEAFCNCDALEAVSMDCSNISELPDAGVFSKEGVFEGCSRLSVVDFPSSLRRIGARTFHKTGLCGHLKLKHGIRSIGAYAFSETGLTGIDLPCSLEHIAPGAFFSSTSSEPLSVSVYKESATGLFEAIQYVPVGSAPAYNNVRWRAADITFLGRDGQETNVIHIPRSIAKGDEKWIELAMTYPTPDREIYLRCFAGLKDKKEKNAFALRTIAEEGDVNDICGAYIRQSAAEIADGLLSEDREEELIDFLKKGYMTADDMRAVLKQSGEKGMSQVSAYILRFLTAAGNEISSRLSL